MSTGGDQALALLELNMRRETWCRVEGDPRRSWERPERKHYRSHLRSSAALRAAMSGGERPLAACRPGLAPAKHPERRHFEL